MMRVCAVSTATRTILTKKRQDEVALLKGFEWSI